MTPPAPAVTELLPGTFIGPYRLVERAGVGGMAEIWRALQPGLDRAVAVKILPRHYASRPGYLERFRREALAISRLDHPHVLSIYDFGEHNGFTYMVMPFIRGGTLQERLGRPWSIDEALAVLGPLAAALDCAHQHGIVHRDFKPSNVLVAEQGRVVLSDFGIARLLEGADDLTQAGMIIGTPLYMSPEQVVGRPATAASDLYALGVLAYEMLTGRRPFQADTPLGTAMAHVHDPLPPPRSINPSLPAAVESVLVRALAKDPYARFVCGAALVEALTRAVAPPPPEFPAPVAAPTRRGKRPLKVGMVFSTLLMLAGALTLATSQPLPPPAADLLSRLRPAAPTAAPEPPPPTLTAPTAAAPPPTSAPAPPVPPVPGRLIRSDDFGDPATGLFRDNQEGTAQAAFSNGLTGRYQWSYGYEDRALVARLLGPYPDNPDQAILGIAASAADKQHEDFAVEVTGQAARSPEVALYGLRYTTTDDSYFYRVTRDAGAYDLWSEKDRKLLSGGRTAALRRAGQPNQLRLEVRGDTIRVFANGQLLDQARHDGLARRGGQLHLFVEMAGPPSAGSVEVRFTDFKVYALTP